jgi:hypothetical protein
MRLRAQWPQIWLRAGGWMHLIAMGDAFSNGLHVAYIMATTDQPCVSLDDGTAASVKPRITRSRDTITAYAPQETEHDTEEHEQ